MDSHKVGRVRPAIRMLKHVKHVKLVNTFRLNLVLRSRLKDVGECNVDFYWFNLNSTSHKVEIELH